MASGKKQYDAFLSMNVNNLNNYLTVRVISVSGYNKIELVAWAYSAAEMDPPIILSFADLNKNLEEECSKCLMRFNILDPKNIEKELRVDNLTAWPKVNLGNIFEYILRMKEFDKEYIGKYKDQKAYSYFDSGYVVEIFVSKINEGTNIALFYSVQGSMSIHNKKEVWVVANPDGMIIPAWCFCMTRASRCCNHVIALLYKVEYANANNFCSPACTSIPCDWNKSTKKIVEPKRISEIAVQKKMRSSMGDKPKDTIPHKEKRMQELNLFDP